MEQTPPEPPTDHAGDLQRQLEGLVRRSRRVLWAVVIAQAALLLLALLAILLLTLSASADRHRIAADEATTRLAECDSHFTIATAPLPVTATKFGVEFVEAQRKAFIVLHCPGGLGPPSPGLVHLGAKYQVPIRY